MAKGRPDFFGTPIHPKYGTSKKGDLNKVCPGGVISTVLDLSAKGVVFAGHLRTVDTDSTINGTFMGSHRPLFLTYYDPDYPRFMVEFGSLIPFEKSFKVTYQPSGVNDVTVAGDLYYYSME